MYVSACMCKSKGRKGNMKHVKIVLIARFILCVPSFAHVKIVLFVRFPFYVPNFAHVKIVLLYHQAFSINTPTSFSREDT